MDEIKFPCISNLTKCSSEKECIISRKGFCKVFKSLCKNFLKKHNFEIIDLSNFFNEFFKNILKSLPNLKINHERGFYKYAEKIGLNVYSDLLKATKVSSINFSDIISQNEDSKKNEENLAIDNSWKDVDKNLLLNEILKMLEEWEDECGDLILFWYSNLGYISQKEMAQELDLKENTFNQKLRRCIKKLKKMVRG